MPRPTRMSWMEMTEQGKAMAEVTFTITESTSSGNSYLKYCGDKEPIAAMVATLPSGCRPLCHAVLAASPAAGRPWH